MQSGLLWFDNDPGRSLGSKVISAAQRYREKFGVAPDTCYVNACALPGKDAVIVWGEASLRVLPAPNILAHHFWVGVEQEKAGG